MITDEEYINIKITFDEVRRFADIYYPNYDIPDEQLKRALLSRGEDAAKRLIFGDVFDWVDIIGYMFGAGHMERVFYKEKQW